LFPNPQGSLVDIEIANLIHCPIKQFATLRNDQSDNSFPASHHLRLLEYQNFSSAVLEAPDYHNIELLALSKEIGSRSLFFVPVETSRLNSRETRQTQRRH
jgi:hypothetical protein